MTSRERADAVLREYYGPNYSSTEFSGKIAAAIDAAVAEERTATLGLIRDKLAFSGCTAVLDEIMTKLEKGIHVAPPPPRYKVRQVRLTVGCVSKDVFFIYDTDIEDYISRPYPLQEDAQKDCAWKNKECQK